MFSSDSRSRSHAKTAFILGHTQSGMGERTLALKFKEGLERAGCFTHPIADIIQEMGSDYDSLAKLNYDLADGEFDLIEDLNTNLAITPSDLLLILSWSFSLAALFATGVHKKQFTAVKLFAHHPNERILKKLYEPASLLIAESLLAYELALKYGIPAAKLLYLPHTFAPHSAQIIPSRRYVQQLAQSQNKPYKPTSRIIGCVSRLEYGKNVEFAIEAVRRLYTEGEDVVLVVKGDFPLSSPYPDYAPLLSQMLACYQHEPWLLWDKTFTPYPQVLEEYASFDLLLHPSGAEGASHVVVECLGLNKPVVLLNCSSNPYLFKDLAYFVPTTGEMREAQLPFYVPDLDALCAMLKKELFPPPQDKVEERFHERVFQERLPLLFEPDPKKLEILYRDDRKTYQL